MNNSNFVALVEKHKEDPIVDALTFKAKGLPQFDPNLGVITSYLARRVNQIETAGTRKRTMKTA